MQLSVPSIICAAWTLSAPWLLAHAAKDPCCPLLQLGSLGLENAHPLKQRQRFTFLLLLLALDSAKQLLHESMWSVRRATNKKSRCDFGAMQKKEL